MRIFVWLKYGGNLYLLALQAVTFMCAKCDGTSFIGLISVHWLLQAKGGSVCILVCFPWLVRNCFYSYLMIVLDKIIIFNLKVKLLLSGYFIFTNKYYLLLIS